MRIFLLYIINIDYIAKTLLLFSGSRHRGFDFDYNTDCFEFATGWGIFFLSITDVLKWFQ